MTDGVGSSGDFLLRESWQKAPSGLMVSTSRSGGSILRRRRVVKAGISQQTTKNRWESRLDPPNTSNNQSSNSRDESDPEVGPPPFVKLGSLTSVTTMHRLFYCAFESALRLYTKQSMIRTR